MNPDSAASRYRNEAFENAPPVKIVRMLFQGGLRFLDRAAACDPQDPASEFAHWVHRTDAIITELRCSLDASHDAQLAEQLRQLYLFVETELAKAIRDRDLEHLENARRVLETLDQAWAETNFDQAGVA